MNKKLFNYDNKALEKIINYLLNNNFFYFILTIISLLFSIFISLNIGSYFVGFIISFWIYYKNNNSNLLGIIITISFIVIYYYLTGIIYCEGGDSEVNTPSPFGDKNTIITTTSDNGVSNYLPDLDLDLNSFSNNLIDYMFNFFFSIIKPVHVTGYFDDLIGQHIAIEVILLYMLIFTIILFIAYIINVVLFINKDYILNSFDNKYIKLYIKYQVFLIKMSLITFPIFILISLFTLIHGIIFLLTHNIPFEQLGVDLHVLVPSESNLDNISNSNIENKNNITNTNGISNIKN